MAKIFKLLLLIFGISTLFISCNLFDAGTHGMIKQYTFSVSKYELEKVINKVIAITSNIYRDTSKHDYYNDGSAYVTIKIGAKNNPSEYIFRYYGDEEMWKVSPHQSEIFVCYAYNSDRNGGKDGDARLTPIIRKQLTDLFEVAFVEKVNAELEHK